jgi:beta-glucanase (GH16 family)
MKFLLGALLAAACATALSTAVVEPARAVTGTDACGSQPLKADGTPWRCTFVDNFAGTVLDRTKWVPATQFLSGTLTTYACFRDNPANVRVRYGTLYLVLQKLASPAPCALPGFAPTRFQSGMVSTYHLFSQQYGRFEARMKVTGTAYPGLHEAFWMWPDDRYGTTSPWPSSGEIDVAELFSVHNDVSVSALHYAADAQGMLPGVNMNACPARRGVWNTYRMEWTPSRIETFVNGRSCLVNVSGDVAFQKPYTLNFTQGMGPEDLGNMPVPGTRFPATTQVDYVRVWR